MSKILAYGEDALTLWALKQRISSILDEFQDKTSVSDCLAFYRPSFGRHGKKGSSVFGEFDAILASKEKVYLIESKWDNLAVVKNDEYVLRAEQRLRHEIFSWYLVNWNKQYSGNWQSFKDKNQNNFVFEKKSIAPKGSLLAKNLEAILTNLQEHCENLTTNNIKNVLLFFHNARANPPTKTNGNFNVIAIDYSKETIGNFIVI